jgi:hypothetical protein
MLYNKWDHPDKMDRFLKRYNQPTVTQEEVENTNFLIISL